MQAARLDRIHKWMVAYGMVAAGAATSAAFCSDFTIKPGSKGISTYNTHLYLELVSSFLPCELSVWSPSRVNAKVCLHLGDDQRGTTK